MMGLVYFHKKMKFRCHPMKISQITNENGINTLNVLIKTALGDQYGLADLNTSHSTCVC